MGFQKHLRVLFGPQAGPVGLQCRKRRELVDVEGEVNLTGILKSHHCFTLIIDLGLVENYDTE